MSNHTDNTPQALSQHQQISVNIAELQEALIAANPLMPTLLRKIHSALLNDPETVTLLTDAERATVIQALMKQTNTVIVTKAVTAKAGKAMKSLDLLDI
jgi:hypothetical protein